MVEDHLEDCDEETKDWEWEEVDVLIPGRLKNSKVGDREDDAEDEICCSIEDGVGKCVLEGRVDVGDVGDEEKGEKSEEEAKDWEQDPGEVEAGIVKVVRKVTRDSRVDFLPSSDVCHAHAINNTTDYRKKDIRKRELRGKGDECLL